MSDLYVVNGGGFTNCCHEVNVPENEDKLIIIAGELLTATQKY
ncbi:hypothetical protein [Pseudomonas sp. RT6P73]